MYYANFIDVTHYFGLTTSGTNYYQLFWKSLLKVEHDKVETFSLGYWISIVENTRFSNHSGVHSIRNKNSDEIYPRNVIYLRCINEYMT